MPVKNLSITFIFPGALTFKSYESNNLIQNFNNSVDDINRANIIYGASIPIIQGQITRHRPQAHDKIIEVLLPSMVAHHHSKVTLLMYLFLSTT